MKLRSLDGTLTLNIVAPGIGFVLTLDGHSWLFDRDGRCTGSLPPFVITELIATGTVKHATVSSPECCPGCKDFAERNYTRYSVEGERR